MLTINAQKKLATSLTQNDVVDDRLMKMRIVVA